MEDKREGVVGEGEGYGGREGGRGREMQDEGHGGRADTSLVVSL